MPSEDGRGIEIKLAVLEERMTTLTDLFHSHVKSDQAFMEQIRTDLRNIGVEVQGFKDWKIKVTAYGVLIGSLVGTIVSLLTNIFF